MKHVAIITGAAQGLGAAIANRLASDGARVALLDINHDAAQERAASLRKEGHQAQAYQVDVSDEDSVKQAVEQVAAQLGAPTILVNNAGVLRDELLFRMSVADWDTVMSVHLRGAFLLSRQTQQYFVQQKFGRIINISSVSALGNRGQANYAAAKAGIQGFTKTLALELGKFGITANCVAPGFIETEMTHRTAERIGQSFAEFSEQIATANPVGRIGQPEDIAAAVSFFAREECGYINGQVLYVSGGPND